MIGKGGVDYLTKIESTPSSYYPVLGKIQEQEPILWDWVLQGQDNDLKILVKKFPHIYDEHPSLPMTLTGLFVKYLMRGILLSEYKWKIDFEDKPKTQNSGDYYPSTEDFK